VTVDVETEIEIARPHEEVAAFAVDPDNATKWYRNIKSVTWKTEPPLTIGTQLEFIAHFLGRRLTYTYEVREYVPGERFVMATAEGPFPMETTYAWTPRTAATTRMTLTNHGEPAGFAKVSAPLMNRAMQRANGKDLELLKRILENA
jgi:ligand-binding SRPBCC domain-containing protein